jgi:hypothetical protein
MVGGTRTSISAAPYQVRIRARDDGRAWNPDDEFSFVSCGGSIVDPTHVVTAAHCVLGSDDPYPARSFRVDAGFSRFDAGDETIDDPTPLPTDTLQAMSVSQVRVHPGYGAVGTGGGSLDELADDVAVLTLTTPLRFDQNAQPIALADPGPSPLGDAQVTGFGRRREGGSSDGFLYALNTPLVDSSVEGEDGAGGENAVYAVSKTPAGSPCQGDSGGPLVQNLRLIGIVSSGPSCDEDSPTFYTSVSAPEIRQFILGDDAPPVAPRGGTDAELVGPRQPEVGQVLRCRAGRWTGKPTYGYTFSVARTGQVLQSGGGDSYAVAPADLGRRIACVATAQNAGGTGRSLRRTTAAVVQPVRLRLRGRVRPIVRAGRAVSLVVSLRNDRPQPGANVRTCLRPGVGFVVVRRDGGSRVGRRVCWTDASVTGTPVTRRVQLRVARRARPGRRAAAVITSTAPQTRSATTTVRVLVRR